MPPANSTLAPLASASTTVAEITAPFLLIATKLLNGSSSSCLIPKEIRSFTASTANTTAETSSPFL